MTYFEPQNSEGVSLTDHIVFFDLEWTSWEGAMENNYSEPWQHQEVIQIVLLCSHSINQRSQSFVYVWLHKFYSQI